MPPKIGQLIDEYETGGRVRGLAPTQLNALKPIRRALGDAYHDRLRPATVARYVAERRQGLHTKAHARRPAADGTIRRELGALAAVLNWAHDKRLIKDRPPTIDLPPASPPRSVFLSKDEADKLWERASDWSHDNAGLFAMLALDTWARAEAIETLPWGRVSLGDPWQIDYRDPARPETTKRRVAVPVSARLRREMERRFNAEERRANELVVGPVTQYAWNRFLAGGPRATARITRHDLRRTGISLALARGVDPLKVAQAAGDDLATIMKHYAHFMPDYLEGLHDAA